MWDDLYFHDKHKRICNEILMSVCVKMANITDKEDKGETEIESWLVTSYGQHEFAS